MKKAAWERALHGTEARARRHRRQGHKPLRRFCPACADAERTAHQLREIRPEQAA